MKKIISYLLIFCLLFMHTVNIFADDENGILIEAESYVDYLDNNEGNKASGGTTTDDVEVTTGGSGEIIIFDKNEWLAYDITAEAGGMYALSMLIAVGSTATSAPVLTVYVNENKAVEKTLETTGGNNTYALVDISNISLEEGENRVKIAASVKSFRFDSFTLKYVGEKMEMLSDENIIEAELADEAPLNIISEATGEAVVFGENDEYNYTLGDVADKVYAVCVNAKGNGTVSFFINDEEIISQEIKNTEYENIYLDNILFYEGKNIVTLKVTEGSLNIDYIKIDSFSLSADDSEDITIYVKEFDRATGNPKTFNTADGGYVSYNPGHILEYDLDIEKAGFYQVVGYFATTVTTSLKITLGETEFSAKTGVTGSYSVPQNMLFDMVWLDEGELTMKSELVSGAAHAFKFFLVYAGEGINVKGITYGENNALAKNVVIPRGTDTFTVHFNIAPLTVDNSNVKIYCDGELVPSKIEVRENTAEVMLVKTLDFDAELEIQVTDIKDGTEMTSIKNTAYTFYTGGEDEGFGYIEDKEVSNEYEAFMIKGKVFSGNGNTIEGRCVDFSLKYPDGSTSGVLVSEFSDENGSFEIKYTLPDNSADGIYEVRLLAEYADEMIIMPVRFVKKSTEESILTQLNNAENETLVKEIFEANSEILGLETENNFAELGVAVTDEIKNDFYGNLSDETFENIDELMSAYKKYLYFNAINYADSKNTVDKVLTDAEAVSALGLSAERVAYVSVNINKLSEEILALEKIESYDKFIDECEKLIEKNIAEETEVSNPVIPTAKVSAESSQGYVVALKVKDGISKVKKVIFYLKSSENLFDEITVKSACDGKAEFEKTADGVNVTVTPEWTLSEINHFADVYLTAPSEVKDYEMKISADITVEKKHQYEGSEEIHTIDVLTKAEEVTLELDVTKASDSSSGGGQNTFTPSGSSSSGGSGGLSGGDVVTPVIPPVIDNPVDDNKVFMDLENVAWAEESIYSLLEKGIVSKADKFNPLDNVKREEFVKMLVLALGIYDSSAVAEFNDAADNAWYVPYIGSAQKAGIVNGDDIKNFGVGKEITREDMSVMIYRALKLEKAENENVFADDKEISGYAKDAVYKMRSLGIVSGMGENMFAPKALANRAQAAKIIDGILMMEVAQ